MDVREWLRGLGLGQYGQKFSDNKIDADVLADLTDGDLEKLGIPLGDRKRLLKAIAASVAPERRAAQTRLVAAAPASAPQTFAPPDAERRPITVMFCDLVGSTSLASRLDVEDFRNILNAYLDEASNAVAGLGGHVLRKLGDGLLALFGYPKAEENDAERAVRAALAIQRALAELNARNSGTGVPELVARIGLESGPVIVDAAGEVFGEAPNVAARVQAAAEPGTVLVTATVQRQVAGLFIVEDKGAHELKGVPVPVTLYRIVRVSGGRRRTGARILTPFIGREEDLGVLARRWERARAGEGQFLLIVGEPGIGKVPAGRRVSSAARRYAAHMDRMEFVAALAEYTTASCLGVGTHPVWRSRRCAGAAARRARICPQADQARRRGVCAPARTAGRHPDTARTPADPSARRGSTQAVGGDGRLGDGRRARAAACSCH